MNISSLYWEVHITTGDKKLPPIPAILPAYTIAYGPHRLETSNMTYVHEPNSTNAGAFYARLG